MDHSVQIIGRISPCSGLSTCQIEPRFLKALKGLDGFSHALILALDSHRRLQVLTRKIASIDGKSGTIAFHGKSPKAELVDIKPFIPCEDLATGCDGNASFGCEPRAVVSDSGYAFADIGNVVQSNGCCCLQFNGRVPRQIGGVVRVAWVFSRFEGARYRRTLLCTPPYKTKGRIGVFASRSPVRPNPIALSIARVLRVEPESGRVYVTPIDAFDGTPFIGVFGYDPRTDAADGARVAEWADGWPSCVSFGTGNCAKADILASELDKLVGEFPPVKETGPAKMRGRPSAICVKGARANNLKGVDVSIPYGKITAIVGVSGSGKSSLAIDTIYAECRRRMEFLGDGNEDLPPADVEELTGAVPVVRISQREIRANPHSTVGSFTGVARHLRALYANLGKQEWHDGNCVEMKVAPSTFNENDEDSRCPVCKGTGVQFAADECKVVAFPEKSLLDGASPFLGNLRSFARRPNANWMKGQVVALAQAMGVDLETPWRDLPPLFRDRCLRGAPELRLSFRGVERTAEGLLRTVERLAAKGGAGTIAKAYLSESPCDCCHGERLRPEGRMVTLLGVRYPVAAKMTFERLERFAAALGKSLAAKSRTCALSHIEAVVDCCRAARRLGIGHLEINRLTSAMSGGEAQRLKLLAAFENHLSGILYIFDEPTKRIGRAEYPRVAEMMRELVGDGNTIIMVEHNPEMISIADLVVEIGPGAGDEGGCVVAAGTYGELLRDKRTLLGSYASRKPPRARAVRADGGLFAVRHVNCHTLRDAGADIRLGAFTCITGPSGAGKSSLLYGGILPQAAAAGAFSKVVAIESKASVTSPQSTVATYTGMMDDIRRKGLDEALRLTIGEAESYFAERCPRAAAMCRRLVGNGLGYLKLGQPTSRLSGGETARLRIISSLGSGRTTNALFLMDEPTCGLHYSDIDRLLALVFELVDAGNTVVAIEHNARFLSAADCLLEMS